MPTYWLVSLPLTRGRRDLTWELLQERTSTGQQMSSNSKLEVPELRVGTLDTLMALSDDMVKMGMGVDTVANKIRRTVAELAGPEAVATLKADNMPIEPYLCRFKWDEPKFPTRRPLKETLDKIGEVVGHIEDELKVKLAEFNVVKSQMSAAMRKAGGSLAVRDVASLVKPEQVLDSENLCTMFVVVSKFSIKEWNDCYETLCDFVVPRSSRQVAEDQDYALFSCVVFKRVADDFRVAARQKGYQVKDYVAPQADVPETTLSLDQLRVAGEEKRAALEAWCRTAYGEAFGCLTHLAVVRLFVESILRYGLPPAFLAAVVKPLPKAEGRLRTVLADTFGTDSSYWKEEGGSSALAGSELDQFPYVSLALSTD